MRGDIVNGWVTLAGDFPPSLNKENDPAQLKPHESPDCYGVDCQKDGRLKTGSALTGTSRTTPAGTGSYTAWAWYYNRLWKAATTLLDYGMPEERAFFLRQGRGQFTADAAIIDFMPALTRAMWVVTASGSHLIENANDPRGFFELGPFKQDMYAPATTCILTLNGFPVMFNAAGVFLYDGREVKELTRAVRDTLGTFAYSASATDTIKANYAKRYIIGQDGAVGKFVIDVDAERLYDYGTSGFRFQSRTLAHSAAYEPFQVQNVAFIIEHGSTAGGTIEWESRIEDTDWFEEDAIEVHYDAGEYTRVEVGLGRTVTTGRRFDVRLTSLSSNIYIKEIQLCVNGYAEGSFTV